jgi:hypothetical protein
MVEQRNNPSVFIPMDNADKQNSDAPFQHDFLSIGHITHREALMDIATVQEQIGQLFGSRYVFIDDEHGSLLHTGIF